MKINLRAIACAVGLLGLSGLAHAMPQMLQPPATTKAAKGPPADVKSGALAVRFNARELHALKIGDEVELALPNGTRHAYVFDQRIDHGDGNATWIGYYRDRDQRLKLNAVVTTGPDGSLGTIETPEGDFVLRLDGTHGEWLVDAKAERALAKPIRLAHDAKFVPEAKVAANKDALLVQPEFAAVIPGVTQPYSSTVPMSGMATKVATPAIVDMLVVYNDSLAAGVGNTTTWANNLIAQANTQMTNSLVNIQLRLAGTMLYSYADNQDDATVLYDISGINPSPFGDVTTAAHTAMENKRLAVGADMVTFYRGGDGANDGGSGFGSGIAWTAQAPVDAGWGRYTYSTVVGCWSTCQFIWTHEVGHNMGNMHDRATAAWENGGGDPGHGSTPDSWGFYTCNGSYAVTALTCNPFNGGCNGSPEPQCASGTNAMHDLMAYFHASPTIKQFSNPNLKCVLGATTTAFDCGIAAGTTINDYGVVRPASADTATSMNANAVALSALRAAVAGGSTTSNTLATSATPMRVGNALTFTATLASSSGTPTGSVAFTSNGATIAGCGAVVVAGGAAQCTTSFPTAGTFTIAAQYTATGVFASSTSNAVSQVIVALPAMIGRPPKRDFDFNGKADIAWNGPTAGLGGAWLMNSTASAISFTPSAINGPANATVRAVGDFDADGKADLLWRGADGTYSISLMNGTSVLSTTQVLAGGSGWDVIGVADFNGDGKADLLLNGPNGQYGVWLMNGAAIATPAVLAPPAAGFVPTLLADMNVDTKTDILWTHANGSITLVPMNGVTPGTPSILLGITSPTWRPTHVADLNGDGIPDLVLLRSDGMIGAWLMNGTAITSGSVLLGAGGGWTVTGTPDLNGDGQADLVIEHVSGMIAGWLMNWPSHTAAVFLDGSVNNGWTVVGKGDYNNDGKDDLLLRRVDGSYGIWLMNGLAIAAPGVLLNGGFGWEVVGP